MNRTFIIENNPMKIKGLNYENGSNLYLNTRIYGERMESKVDSEKNQIDISNQCNLTEVLSDNYK